MQFLQAQEPSTILLRDGWLNWQLQKCSAAIIESLSTSNADVELHLISDCNLRCREYYYRIISCSEMPELSVVLILSSKIPEQETGP
jgi:hypothetical protein